MRSGTLAADPAMMQMQMANFMKNVSMLGCALIISYFGAGAWSLDARVGRGISAEAAAEEERERKLKEAA